MSQDASIPEPSVHGSPIPVQLKSVTEGRVTGASVQVQFWNSRQRARRALKFGGMFWIGAIVSLFIPLLHFILVPAFLIAGPILAYFILNQNSIILGGSGKCPNCDSTFVIARAANRFPFDQICVTCHQNVKIVR